MTPRDTARAWLADPLGVVLDTETTSLDGYVVEIAVVTMAGEVLLNELLHPEAPMDPGAEKVHGIRLDSLAEARRFSQAAEDVRRVVGGRSVVAYNAAFDRKIMDNEWRLLGAKDPVGEWRCAMLLVAGGGRWRRLDGGDHSALGDCRAALAALRRVADV